MMDFAVKAVIVFFVLSFIVVGILGQIRKPSKSFSSFKPEEDPYKNQQGYYSKKTGMWGGSQENNKW